jgi:hypothetical protein
MENVVLVVNLIPPTAKWRLRDASELSGCPNHSDKKIAASTLLGHGDDSSIAICTAVSSAIAEDPNTLAEL